MSVLHIFRGLPGSGKTTAARKLAAETGAILIEPDALLVQDGEYQYTKERWCAAFGLAMDMVFAINIRSGCDIIFADVLPRIMDVDYVTQGLAQNGYRVTVHDLKITAEESLKRNKHNVRREDIERMAKEWEDWKE